MSAVLKKEYTMDDSEAKYHDITALYVFADELVNTVKNPAVTNKQAQIALVEPLINELADITDFLSEEFIQIAESKRSRVASKASKSQIEGALRKLSAAISDYHTRAKALGSAAANVADVVVKKISKQVDKVIGVFLEFIQISLQNIMSKAEVDALKARDSAIALMMHKMSLSAHGG